MNTYQTRCIVFVEHPALLEIVTYGRQYDWQLIKDVPAGATRNAPRELVFKAGRASLEVHYCEDDITHNSYAFSVGAGRNVAESLIAMIERDLNCWTRPQLLEEFDQNVGFDAKGRILLRLAISAPGDFDQDVYDRVCSALRDPEERLRSLAIWATSYTPWPEYRTLLGEIAAEDGSEGIRERASRMLASFDVAGVEQD